MTETIFDFPSRKETRYWSGDINQYELALSVRKGSYFTHHTALHLHDLISNPPDVIYLNVEQSEKPKWKAEMTQEAIDTAFERPPRVTSNVAKVDGRSIFLLNGMFTGELGVTTIQHSKVGQVRLTDIERTMIDVVVRPHYSGGVSSVLEAYKNAVGRVSIPKLTAILAQLDYVYPYHQAIGFFLEQAGFASSEVDQLRALPMEFDFYLASQMENALYSKSWRVHYPANLVVTSPRKKKKK